ncbi:MAG: VOC family protein [Lautropia sp.]|nr:VOC family protein [Lautropia sp.]
MPRINHIALYTSDLDRSREFYEKYFSATSGSRYHNQSTGLQTYFLSFPSSDVRLELMTRPGLSERPDHSMNEGFIHLAISVGSAQAVDALTARLMADGYHCMSGPRTTGDGYYESVVTDPDGNLLEITV